MKTYGDAEGDYFVLNSSKVEATIHVLSKRIDERFPRSGLFQVCRRLHDIASQASVRSVEIRRPLWWVRFLALAATLSIVALALSPLLVLDWHADWDLERFVPLLDGGMNVVVIVGGAILFLVTLENRIKRKRALKALHEIRSIAHIIDMHQLTKDPERLNRGNVSTRSSPQLKMSAFELGRYLDYCTEMLSLTSKVATLYVQHFDDPVAVATSNEIEQLCTSLARKIWQKIMILQETNLSPSKPAQPVTEAEPASEDSKVATKE